MTKSKSSLLKFFMGSDSFFDFAILGRGKIRFRFSCCNLENFMQEEHELHERKSSKSQFKSLENSIASHSFALPF